MCVERSLFLSRVAAIIASLFVLSGCVVSSYDISADLRQLFPLEPGDYVIDSSGGGSGKYTLIRTVDGYDNFFEQFQYSQFGTPIRLFKLPEYGGYIMQTEDS